MSNTNSKGDLSWENLRTEFEPDGTLRDIYILNTLPTDWQRFIDFLRKSGVKLDYYTADGLSALPSDITNILEKGLATLIITGTVSFNCYFFCRDEIELDFEPAQIHDEVSLKYLMSFISDLGKALGLPVIVTPESGQPHPILQYDPTTEKIEYFPE